MKSRNNKKKSIDSNQFIKTYTICLKKKVNFKIDF